MEFGEIRNIVINYYNKMGFSGKIDNDIGYLETSFHEINTIWEKNLKKIKKVNIILLAESPLWGTNKKYIYNPFVSNTQFLYRSVIGKILKVDISDNHTFINVLNKMGLVVIDISPFSLNSLNTIINYNNLSKANYKELIALTIPYFFEKKIKSIIPQKSDNCIALFRYTRVKNAFEELVADILVDHQILKSKNEIETISKKGGGIDVSKFDNILKINQIIN